MTIPSAIIRRAVPPEFEALAASGVDPVLARIFAARGVRSPAELDYGLAALPPWSALRGVDAAASRLHRAIDRKSVV